MIWKINDTYNWTALEQKFDWIREMKNVPQSPIYHAEGDVAIHTQMVLEELFQLDEYQYLNEQDQHILAAAALLHDVEKRSTTVIESEKRITSKGHAKKGEYTARSILYKDVSTPFRIRETVAKLVRHHGLPLWIFEKQNPVQYLAKVSHEVNTELLAILAEADMRGRICPDKEEVIYRIQLFKELCMEHDCWGKPKSFASNLTRFKYLNVGDISPDYPLFDDTKLEVILLSGLPGTGKDTFIQKQYSDWPVVSLDNIRRANNIAPDDKKGNGKVVQMAKENAKEHLRSKTSFVWNATNTTQQMREQLIDLFTTYNAKVKIVYLEVPYQLLVQQNKNREHVVPQPVMEKLINKLEIPNIAEAHEVEYHIKDEA